MPTNTVQININAKDNATPVIKKVTVNLKEMGEKTAQIGMRMSAAFTLPVVGLAAIIGQSKEVQAALKPVTDEFTKIGAQIGTAFLPVIKQAVPLILELGRGIEGVVSWFAKLDPSTKNIIVGVGLFVAAIGPAITIIGTMVQTVGLLQETLPLIGIAIKGVGASMAGAAIPILAVSAALIALYELVNMTEFKQVLAMSEAGWAMIFGGREAGDKAFIASAQRQGLIGKGKAAGGPVSAGTAYPVGEMGPEMFVPGQSGTIIPNNRIGGGIVVNVTYAPMMSTASRQEFETNLVPVIQKVIRDTPGR
jgi:hypothetical protein